MHGSIREWEWVFTFMQNFPTFAYNKQRIEKQTVLRFKKSAKMSTIVHF